MNTNLSETKDIFNRFDIKIGKILCVQVVPEIYINIWFTDWFPSTINNKTIHLRQKIYYRHAESFNRN